LVAAAATALFHKNEILTDLKSGETIKIHFSSGTGLVAFESKVKIAYIAVGTVTGIHRDGAGGSVVSVKVNHGTRAKLGSAPSAVVRPTTLLGGNYFVDLEPGGDHGTYAGSIPVSRTALPVELDKVAAILQPNAIKGARAAASALDATMRSGGGSALDRLVSDAPAALVPVARVLTAVQGTNPETDLTGLVSGLETTARVLTAKQGQLDDIVTKLHTTTSVFAARAADIATTLGDLPATLASTNAGLARLDVTLAKLRDTSSSAGPVVSALDTTLKHANPLLVSAAPVTAQLNTLLTSAEPLVQQLVPTTQNLTSTLDAVRGPVLDRVDGSLKTWLLDPYHGAGPYAGTGSAKPLYEEIGYTAAVIDRASSLVDKNGSAIALEAGVGAGSVDGLLPISLEQMFEVLTAKLHLSAGLGGK
jgi:phospholipid/cholesterol/gamma-HCH transport system substrate-binding protein